MVATIIASFLNPLIHKQFGCLAPLIRAEVKVLWSDSRFLDYVRMKGIFRKNYTDIVREKKRINTNGIIGLARELKPTLGRTDESNKDFDPSFNYSIVFDQLMKHHSKNE